MHQPPSLAPILKAAAIGYDQQSNPHEVEQRRDPWAPFRIWVAFTIGLFAVRAVSLTTPLTWLGAIPGWFLLLLVLIALLLAARALLFPGRVQPWREGEPGLWAEISDDWRHWRQRRSRGGRSR
jgi:hypothetical protein